MVKFFPGTTISKIHGTSRTQNGIIYFAMYHPAAALHQGNLRQTLKEDIQKLPPLLAQAKAMKIKTAAAEAHPKPEPPVQQLSMF
jgi:DNA polymerase